MKTPKILLGTLNLLGSKKGVMCLLMMFLSTFLAFFEKLNPTFAVVMGTVSGIYMFIEHQSNKLELQAKLDLKQLDQPTLLPGIEGHNE